MMTDTEFVVGKLRSFIQRQTLWFAVVSLLVAGVAIADEHEEETFSLSTITCWDLTGVEAEAQVPTLMLVFGYVAGVHDLDEHNGKEIGPALERVCALCTSNPDMYVASAIERVLLP